MLRHRVTIEYVLDDKYDHYLPSQAEWLEQAEQMTVPDGFILSVMLDKLCTWPGCNKIATHPGLGAMPDESNQYCDDHCVGGG